MPIISSRTSRQIKIYGLLIILSLAVLWLGHDLEKRQWHALIVHFMNEIGIAGLVGFVLAFTIERISQEEFRKLAEEEREQIKAEFRKLAEEERAQIKRDVFYYVYGHEIPPAIRDEIDSHILKVPFVRREMVIQYHLQPVRDSKGEWYVLTNFTMNYDVENLTADELKFPFIAAIDKSPSDEFAKKTEFVSLTVTGCKTPFNWDRTVLMKRQDDEDSELVLNLPGDIVLFPKPPAGTGSHPAANKLTHIKLKTQTVRFLKGGHIDFFFTSHICDLTLMVWADTSLKVSARTSEQNPLERISEPPPILSWITEEPNFPGEFSYWTLRKPLLAYQALKVSWDLVKESSVEPGGVETDAGEAQPMAAPQNNQ